MDPAKLANRLALDQLSSLVKILILTSNNHEGLAEKLSELDLYIHKHSDEELLDISPICHIKWISVMG